MRSPRRRKALVVLGAAALLIAGVPTAQAQTGTEVIASGLNNPRGLTFSPDGALYVAESGAGGTGPCFLGPEGPACFGHSASVTKVDKKGNQSRVLTGLPSYGGEGTGNGAIGASDVAFRGRGTMYVTVGLGLDLPLSPTLAALDDMGQLVSSRLHRAGTETVTDLAEFEQANNPTEDELNVNPNSVLTTSRGEVVSDAGANDLLLVSPGGKVKVLATFENRLVDAPPFLGLPPGTQIPMDAVPTSVAEGPDHALYVSQLTGFPFPLGGANVYRVPAKGGTPEVFASGFTNIIDLAFDRKGTLYVLEIFQNGLLSGDPTGALIRVDKDGTQHVISDDLFTPGGLALHDGAAYVSNCGTCAGGGEVLRIPLS